VQDRRKQEKYKQHGIVKRENPQGAPCIKVLEIGHVSARVQQNAGDQKPREYEK
jgi:hypothetical protein